MRGTSTEKKDIGSARMRVRTKEEQEKDKIKR